MTMSRELGTPKLIQRNEVQYPVLITACTCLLISQYLIGTYPIGLLGVARASPVLPWLPNDWPSPMYTTRLAHPMQYACESPCCQTVHTVWSLNPACTVYTNATGECTDVQFVSIVPTPPCLLVRSITPAPPPSMHLADGHPPHVRTSVHGVHEWWWLMWKCQLYTLSFP